MASNATTSRSSRTARILNHLRASLAHLLVAVAVEVAALAPSLSLPLHVMALITAHAAVAVVERGH